ncbi:MAG: hypothetical protein H0V54_03945 [Chthoniobacterales bacterium]|nr:hypothetical protein [Chthoniobacterales bacterium]
MRFAKDSGDVRAIGKELGARYVMNGSLRQVGTRLRVAVQLVDQTTGEQVWAETYERAFSAEAVFELQDDLVPRIVATVGDAHGILPHNMSESLRSKAIDQLSPYEAVLRSFAYGYRYTPEEHAAIRSGLEQAVQKAPSFADAWAMLSLVYADEYASGSNVQPDSLGRALRSARRAVDAAPSSAMAHNALARALFFRKEFEAFRAAAERSIALNPLNSPTLASLGTMMAGAGDWEGGCAQVERALQLNPRHPGWYWFVLLYHAYRKGDYQGALSIGLKINLPDFFATHEAMAAAYGQLGQGAEAERSVGDLLRLKPDYTAWARERLEKWFEPEFVEHLLEGLRKAGLEIAGEDGAPAPISARAGTSKSSGKTRAQEAFWVAVLPFKSSGGIESFADGLGEDITTGLSRFPYLSVVARAAAARLKGRAGDERTLGAELGARYVVEGSIRKQGSAIRVSARLIDTETGAQLWAETYDRDLEVSNIFTVQDDIAARIVATVADSYGVLVNSMAAVAAAKDDVDLTAAEWQFQYFAYRQQITPANHAVLKKRLEVALERDKTRAEIWSCLAQMYVDAYAFGFQADPNDLDRALEAARRGVEFDRTNQFGLVSLAQTYFFRQDLAAFRPAAERAMALNPLNTDALGILGLLIVHTGEFERGGAIVRHAMELNPDHAGWMHFGPIWEHFHKHEYERALDHANRVDIPGLFWPYLVVAAVNGHLGRRTEAEAAVRDLLAIDPEFAAHARSNIASWHFASGLLEPLLDGLRKAGLSADHRFSDGV